MYIRKANQSDIPGLHRLLQQVLMVHHLGRPDLFRAGSAKYTDEELCKLLSDPSRPVFVAADENECIHGYAFCVFQQHIGHNIMTDVRTLYIDDLCVDEGCRGSGVGTVLYRHVLDFARAEGCYNVTLNVWSCNESALKFYEKMGLKPQKIGMETIL